MCAKRHSHGSCPGTVTFSTKNTPIPGGICRIKKQVGGVTQPRGDVPWRSGNRRVQSTTGTPFTLAGEIVERRVRGHGSPCLCFLQNAFFPQARTRTNPKSCKILPAVTIPVLFQESGCTCMRVRPLLATGATGMKTRTGKECHSDFVP